MIMNNMHDLKLKQISFDISCITHITIYTAVRFGKNVTISGNRIFSGAAAAKNKGLFHALFGGR